MMNYDFEIFTAYGIKFLILMVIGSLKVLVLAALIFLPVKIFRTKSLEIRHFSWIVVLLGMLLLPFSSYLLTPPILVSVLPDSLSNRLIRQTEFTNKKVTQTSEISNKITLKHENIISDDFQVNQLKTKNLELIKQDSEANYINLNSSNKVEIFIIFSLLAIYLIGFVFMVLRFLRGLYKTQELLRSSKIINDKKLTNLCNRLIKKPWFSSQVKILSSIEITSPVTTGFFSPKILLPEDWITWEDLKIKSVLAHEAAHIQRKDFLFHLLAKFNKCLNWFNPLSWIAERRISELAEIASDNSAIAFVEDPHKYAEYLLEFAAKTKINICKTKINGVTMVRDFQLVRRIDLILQTDRNLIKESKFFRAFIGSFAFCTLFVAVILGIDLRSERPNEILPSSASTLAIENPSNEKENSFDKNLSKIESTSGTKSDQMPQSIAQVKNTNQSVQNSQQKQSAISVESSNLPINNPVVETKLSNEVVSNNNGNLDVTDKLQSNEIGNESSFEELVSTLNNSNPALREKAAAILKQKRDKRAVEPLIKKLNDGNAKVRQQAAESLGAIGDERAVKPLLNSLKDGNYNVRQSSSKALGDLGNDQAVESLQEMIKDNNQSVRQEAENSLRKLNKKIKE